MSHEHSYLFHTALRRSKLQPEEELAPRKGTESPAQQSFALLSTMTRNQSKAEGLMFKPPRFMKSLEFQLGCQWGNLNALLHAVLCSGLFIGEKEGHLGNSCMILGDNARVA